MRKLILQMQTSVDGFAARRDKGGPDWQVWDWSEAITWDDALVARFNSFVESAGGILLSRKILEGGYLKHWSGLAEKHPRMEAFAFARKIVDLPKVVFSRTLKESPWPNVELAARPLVEEVEALKAQRGKVLVAFGGVGFASALIANDLVDEYQFYVNPVALHSGVNVFEKRGIDSDLELLEAKAYDCGVVVHRYAPQGRA